MQACQIKMNVIFYIEKMNAESHKDSEYFEHMRKIDMHSGLRQMTGSASRLLNEQKYPESRCCNVIRCIQTLLNLSEIGCMLRIVTLQIYRRKSFRIYYELR